MGKVLSGALFSLDRRYRYKLWRMWDSGKPCILFIGLNPSTANELTDDPTVRRCIGFSQKWAMGGMFMGNLYALVSADPKVLGGFFAYEGEPSANLKALMEMSEKSSIVIVAWGSIFKYSGPDDLRRAANKSVVRFLNRPLFCLGVNKDGQPKHPLYLSANTVPQEWSYG